MSQQSIPALTLSLTATGTITSRRFVTVAGAQAGAAANPLGVANFDATSGQDLAVTVLGTAVVESGGAFSAGAELETDSSGRAVAKTGGPVVARALQAATAAGEFVEALLLPSIALAATIASRTASGSVAANRFVTVAGAQAGADANTIGVAMAAGTNGNAFPVAVAGIAKAEAGAAISAGAELETDANGKAIAKTNGPVVARALQAAAQDGDLIDVLLIPNIHATKYSILYPVENLAAGADFSAHQIHKAPLAETVAAVTLFSRGAPAGIDDANTCVVAVKKGVDIVASKTFNTATPFPAEGASIALDPGATLDLAAGDTLTLDVTNGATADPPAFDLQVDLLS